VQAAKRIDRPSRNRAEGGELILISATWPRSQPSADHSDLRTADSAVMQIPPRRAATTSAATPIAPARNWRSPAVQKAWCQATFASTPG
jgi:hypothetical protein